MGWIDTLHGKLVCLDTAPLIYYVEEHPRYLPLIDPFFSALANGGLRATTSTITVIELLTQPLRLRRFELAQRYRDLLLHSDNLTLSAISPEIAEEAARLRALHGLRTPDATVLATASGT